MTLKGCGLFYYYEDEASTYLTLQPKNHATRWNISSPLLQHQSVCLRSPHLDNGNFISLTLLPQESLLLTDALALLIHEKRAVVYLKGMQHERENLLKAYHQKKVEFRGEPYLELTRVGSFFFEFGTFSAFQALYQSLESRFGVSFTGAMVSDDAWRWLENYWLASYSRVVAWANRHRHETSEEGIAAKIAWALLTGMPIWSLWPYSVAEDVTRAQNTEGPAPSLKQPKKALKWWAWLKVIIKKKPEQVALAF